jgi:proteasome lid subunit RPN8/RPN11
LTKNESTPGAKKSDFGRIEMKDLKAAKFPVNLAGEYRVHLTRNAGDKMKAHAATTSEVELCGVLVGEICKDDLGAFVEISDVIEGRAANNYGSQVTFTHETWSHIHSAMDQKHPGKRIVGWYHTHPGFGVFLSGMDTFIQENFFNEPYQVAIVIETKQQQLGCFAWKNGKSVPLRRLWIGDDEVLLQTGEAEPFDPEARSSQKSEREPEPARQGGRPSWGLGTLLGIACGCMVGWLAGRYISAAEVQRAAMDSIQSEVYSILEYAAMNVSAGKDFEDVEDRLGKIEGLLKDHKEKEALEALQGCEKMIAGIKGTYQLDRSRFRSDMADVAARKRTLAQSVQATEQRESVLEEYLADLYLTRINSFFAEAGTTDLAKFPPQLQQMVKICLDRSLTLCPEAKPQIQQMYPGLIEFFYPEPKPPAGAAEGKPGAEKAPRGKTSTTPEAAR